jgi:hypothetical protein
MDPRSEACAAIEMVSTVAPWVVPATVAIFVGGLVVVASLIDAPRQLTPSDSAGAAQGISAADRVTANLENRPDARAN